MRSNRCTLYTDCGQNTRPKLAFGELGDNCYARSAERAYMPSSFVVSAKNYSVCFFYEMHKKRMKKSAA